MKITFNKQQYKDIICTKDKIILDNSKQIEIKQLMTYTVTQKKYSFSSSLLYYTTTKHTITVTIPVEQTPIIIELRLNEWEVILKQLQNIPLKPITKKNQEAQEIINVGQGEWILPEQVDNFVIKQFKDNDDSNAQLGIWMHLKNGQEIERRYCELEQVDKIINRLSVKEVYQPALYSELNSEELFKIFLTWFGLAGISFLIICFMTPLFVSKESTGVVYATLLVIDIFAGVLTLMTFSNKQAEHEKYETIRKEKTETNLLTNQVIKKGATIVIFVHLAIIALHGLINFL
ncbi:MAG: hypothetical protein ACRC6X_07780 [Culicoidibacterales bacterium]